MAGGFLAASMAMAAGPSLSLEWGRLETSSDEQQAIFKVLRSSARAPTVQRLSARGTAPWLVQFNGVVREEWKTALEEAGGAIRGYLPENAFLVEATPEVLARVAAMENVVWAGEYLPAYKRSPAIRERRADDAEVREWRVRLFNSGDKARIVRALGEMGATVLRSEARSDPALFRAWLSPEQVDEMANLSEVEWIEPYQPPRAWGTSGPAADAPDMQVDLGAALQEVFDAGERIRPEVRGIVDSGAYGEDSRTIDRFVWEHPEMLVAAAAGNAAADLNPADGVVDAGSVGSPATAKNALAVGAAEGRCDTSRVWRDSWPEDFAVEPIAMDPIAQADGPQGLSAFSGRGPCADGRIKPDLVAPGTFIVVPRSRHPADTGWGVAADTNFIYVGGTGVAAEQVADAAKQARRWLAEERGIAAPSAALVKALLINGARNLAPGQYGAGAKQEIPFARPNSAQGFGEMDLSGSFPPPAGEFLDLHDDGRLATGAADTFELKVAGAGAFTLTLAYSDYCAAPGAGKKLVNDLDLTVQKPSGALLHANGRTSPDAANNVEMIEFEADETGTYVARVEARAVSMGGTQPYALVVRGPRMEAAAAAALETP